MRLRVIFTVGRFPFIILIFLIWSGAPLKVRTFEIVFDPILLLCYLTQHIMFHCITFLFRVSRTLIIGENQFVKQVKQKRLNKRSLTARLTS